jgi:hypothetical protein
MPAAAQRARSSSLHDAVSACGSGSIEAKASASSSASARRLASTHGAFAYHDGRVRPLAVRHEGAELPRGRQPVHDRPAGASRRRDWCESRDKQREQARPARQSSHVQIHEH